MKPDVEKLRAAIEEMDDLKAEGKLTQAEYDRIYDEAFPHANGNGQFLLPLIQRNPSGVKYVLSKKTPQ